MSERMTPTTPPERELVALLPELPGPAYRQKFYCNKCGYMGDTGPRHQREGCTYPDQCDYDATGGEHYYSAVQLRAYAVSAIAATRAATLPQAVSDQDALDAARWRAVVGCARVRLLGSAGLHSEFDMYGNPHGNFAHIGLELWTQHEAGSHPEAIAYFTKFADKAVAARTPPPAELGKGDAL